MGRGKRYEVQHLVLFFPGYASEAFVPICQMQSLFQINEKERASLLYSNSYNKTIFMCSHPFNENAYTKNGKQMFSTSRASLSQITKSKVEIFVHYNTCKTT